MDLQHEKRGLIERKYDLPQFSEEKRQIEGDRRSERGNPMERIRVGTLIRIQVASTEPQKLR
jgi:hypothetical protein